MEKSSISGVKASRRGVEVGGGQLRGNLSRRTSKANKNWLLKCSRSKEKSVQILSQEISLNLKLEKIKLKRKIRQERVAVSLRKQPPREAAAAAELEYIEMVHSESENLDSDLSSDSCGLEDAWGKCGAYCTDTEFHEINSGVDRDEFREKTKKKRNCIRNPRSTAPPVLERFNSTDCHSQECVIKGGVKRYCIF